MAEPSVRSILVADEDPIIRLLTSHILTRRRLHVNLAADAGELMDRLEQGEYDVILVDVRMLENAGEWVETLAHRAPGVASRLVLMSSTELPAPPPVRSVLRKPLELDELVAVVDAAMTRD